MEKYVKHKGLFGDDKVYKSLGYLHDQFDTLTPKAKRKVTNIINGLDVAIKALSDITNLPMQAHFLKVTKGETIKRLENLKGNYEINSTYVDYLLNFTNAKVNKRLQVVIKDAAAVKKARKEKQKADNKG